MILNNITIYISRKAKVIISVHNNYIVRFNHYNIDHHTSIGAQDRLMASGDYKNTKRV